MDPKCMHVKNEISYAQFFPTIVLQKLNNGQVMEDKWKLVQFATIFSLLSKGKPMIDYDHF
jgi:hypothetical protein